MKVLIQLLIILVPIFSFGTAVEVSILYTIKQSNDTTFHLSKKSLSAWYPDTPEYTFYADSILEFNLCETDPNRVKVWTNRGLISASFYDYDVLLDIDESLIHLGQTHKLKSDCWSTIYQTEPLVNDSIFIDNNPINISFKTPIVGFNFNNNHQIILSEFKDSTQIFYKYFNARLDTITTFKSTYFFDDIYSFTNNAWIGLSYQNDQTIIYNPSNNLKKLDTIYTNLHTPIFAPYNWFGSDTLYFFENKTMFNYNIDNGHLGSSKIEVDEIINTGFFLGEFMNEHISTTRAFTVHKNDSLYLSLNSPDNTVLSLGHKDSTWAIPTYDIIGGLSKYTSKKIIEMYPNPATNTISITNRNTTLQSYEIYNSLGFMLSKQKKNSPTIDINHLTAGHYIIKIITLEDVYKSTFIKL